MKIKHVLLLACILIFMKINHISASVQIHPNAGSTSASFLKIGVGSRAISMGSAFAGLSDDASALYWNPAGLMQIRRNEISLTHNESFEEIRHDFAGYVYPAKNYVLGCALYGLYMPKDIERRGGLYESDPFEPLSPVESYFQAYDFAAQISYSRQLTLLNQPFYIGGNLKYIHQNIDNYNANAVGIDIGSLYQFKKIPLSAGLVLQNIGTRIKFIEKSYDLPFNIKFGTAYKWNKKITTTLDFNQPSDNYLFIGTGTEYMLLKILALRAGYRYRINGLELGDLSGLSAGIGFNYTINDLSLKFDYAYVPYGVLGNSHRISIGMLFGKEISYTIPAKPSPQTLPAAEKKTKIMTDVSSSTVKTAPIITNESDYTFYIPQMEGKLKMASGRSAIYSVNAQFSHGNITSMEWEMTIPVSKAAAFKAGEKNGKNIVYKYFTFKKNFSQALQKVTIKLKLPDYIIPVIKTDNNIEIPCQKEFEDRNFCYYKIYLNTLESFRIESK